MSSDHEQSEYPYSNLAKVASVLPNGYRIVINWGQLSGVRRDQHFLIFGLGPEIFDPVTGNSLGQLELVRGVGKVVHLQETMATVESTEVSPGKKVTRHGGKGMYGYTMFGPESETEVEPPNSIPFSGPLVGDFARPI